MDTMQGLKRTDYCGTFTAADDGRQAVVCGWVQRVRDKGMLVFIDLRDRTGVMQLAFDDKTAADLRAKAQTVRAEFVLMAKGTVRRRESVNRDIPTGEVELYVDDLRILASSEEAGVYAVFTNMGRQIFITGHSEYDADTLKNEYLRDIAAGKPIEIPKNYFPNDDPTRQPLVRWRSSANLLFSNWLNYFVYQTTPYDLRSLT